MDNIPMRPPKLPGYDFVQMLGSGATATVYLYNQRMPARPVAVKASAKTLDPRAAALFNREANFMAKLSSHPYILPVYGAGVTSDGHGYIVIEYAPGGTYNSIMKARSMTCEQVLDLGIKLSSALFTAHRSNIIHHDIKPSNILITSQGLPVLGDFGISTDVYDRTETGFSPPWAPPEVLQHLTNGSEAADIYSLAATLYAMFVGCSPFQHDYHPRSQSELISLIVNQPLPRLNRPDVPADVEAVLRRAEQGGAAPNTVIRYKEITVDTDSLTVLVGTESVSLTTREFEILKLLLENQGLDGITECNDVCRVSVLADGQLADRDNALGLESDVNEHLVMLDLNDSAVNEIALIKVGNRTVDEVVHLLLVDIVKRENGRVLNLTQRWTPFELRGPDC